MFYKKFKIAMTTPITKKEGKIKLKNIKISGHHTSKNIENQIINNIRKHLNIYEKLILLISKKYTYKIFKLGCQYYFNWDQATCHTNIKNATTTQNLRKENLNVKYKCS